MPIVLRVCDQSGSIWTPLEHLTARAAVAMVLDVLDGPETQAIQIVPALPSVPLLHGTMRPKGHLNPETGLITFAAGPITGRGATSPMGPDDRLARIVLTSSHEAVHAVQRHHGHTLPPDSQALVEYSSDPWYEVEARTVSMEVLQGRWPELRGALPMGPSGRLYPMPGTSRFRQRWDLLDAEGPWWTEQGPQG